MIIKILHMAVLLDIQSVISTPSVWQQAHLTAGKIFTRGILSPYFLGL
jgi:hypothetical protein